MALTDNEIARIASTLRVSNGTVRMVAEAIDRLRTAPELKHKGGGYYELPDGSTVRGKAKAEAVIAQWQTLPL